MAHYDLVEVVGDCVYALLSHSARWHPLLFNVVLDHRVGLALAKQAVDAEGADLVLPGPASQLFEPEGELLQLLELFFKALPLFLGFLGFEPNRRQKDELLHVAVVL
eukprot:CAMPEP_0170496800 /NCGR_PEP_ID=MMETSP0208-20121228/22732_1 /TAXON_ID=197538 /ORGANISM="Strombidium inclinatum, Strain S3" /LENGTH=106 /DNA_ID=CAMNT_0010773429 /DNA_START=419 /DNA_END=739 /DNA_ORIENTATION=+